MSHRYNLVLLATLATGMVRAGEMELKPETLKAWNEHIHKATLAIEQRLKGGGPYLRVEENADRMARVRGGEIVVWPTDEMCPKRVSSGLIHDWMGAVFIPGVRIEDVLSVARNYARYKEAYRPGVLDARPLSQTPGEDRFSVILRNGSYFAKTAVEGEFDSSYTQLDENRWYSVACSTRVQEIDNYGLPGERKLAPDEGHGYIWRMCGFSQFEERDGGVYIDEEMIALSRDVPAAIRWMAGPIIRRVSKESLTASIEKTREAVRARASFANVTKRGGGLTGDCGRAGAVGCMR